MTERIMMHAPYPEMPTGYGNMVKLILPRLAKHYGPDNTALSCTAGIVRHNTTWQGIKVYGRSPYTDMAEDLITHHYKDFGADLVITLCCPWKMHGQVWKHMRTIHLMPVDRTPLGVPDLRLLHEGHGTPGAVSRFGEKVLKEAGQDPLYLPHFIDTGIFRPPADRAQLRRALGLDHMFIVGMNASNSDLDDRKAFFPTIKAFARFHAKHPRSVLALHAAPQVPDGVNLLAIADHCGLPPDALIFTDLYQLASAGAAQEDLAAWYGMQDVHVLVSKGEGYGIPLAEAQACGTPVITMGWSTGPELAGPGWTVDGQEDWNEAHHAAWHHPFIHSIEEKLGDAYEQAASRREAARQFAAENLDVDLLWERHWRPVLESL